MPAGPRRAGGEGGGVGSEHKAEGSSPTAITSLISLTPCQQSRKADGKKKKHTRKLTEISSPRVSQLREQVFFFAIKYQGIRQRGLD